MECDICGELEQSFIDARRQCLSALKQGNLAPEQIGSFSRAELKALLEVMDHRAKHRWQPAAGDSQRPALPSKRNMGGIISPF